MLEIRDLVVCYGMIEALHGVSIDVRAGEVVTLIGANGAGKTTLLRAVSGLLRPRRGQILFEGKPISALPPHDIVRLGISHSPEGRQVFPDMTVRENLMVGAYTRRDKAQIAADLDRIRETFPVLGTRDAQKAGTPSGGEQQMLAMGRALMARPRLLLLDEPSLGLAPLIVRRIFQIVREISAAGTTLLLVEQNAHMALSVAQRGYVLQSGKVVLSDTSAALLDHPEVKAAYLGG